MAEMVGTHPVELTARALDHGLRDLGWVDGRSVVIARRSAEGEPERAPAIFAELLARRVDVIVAAPAQWLQDAGQKATRRIPIVTPRVLRQATPASF